MLDATGESSQVSQLLAGAGNVIFGLHNAPLTSLYHFIYVLTRPQVVGYDFHLTSLF